MFKFSEQMLQTFNYDNNTVRDFSYTFSQLEESEDGEV